MKKGFTELVFILDKSGSMAGLESDTIGGFNSMLKKQKGLDGECRITTVLFDHRYEEVWTDVSQCRIWRTFWGVAVFRQQAALSLMGKWLSHAGFPLRLGDGLRLHGKNRYVAVKR